MNVFERAAKKTVGTISDIGSTIDDVITQPVVDVVEGVGDLAQNTFDTVKGTTEQLLQGDLGGAVDELKTGLSGIEDIVSETYMDIRDPLQAAAVMVGNYFLPGSSIITSKLVSDEAQTILNTNGGQLMNMAAGVGGGVQGNLSNYGVVADAATGANATPELLGEAGGNTFALGAPSEGVIPLGEAAGTTTADTLASQTEKMLAPVRDAVPSTPGEIVKLENMANATSDPIGAMNAAKGYTASDLDYLKSIGVPDSIIANAPTTSAEVIGGATPAAAATTTSSITDKLVKGKVAGDAIAKIATKAGTPTDGGGGSNVAEMSALIGLLLAKRKESEGRRKNPYGSSSDSLTLAVGGAVPEVTNTIQVGTSDDGKSPYATAATPDTTGIVAPTDAAATLATVSTTDSTDPKLMAQATTAGATTDATGAAPVTATTALAPSAVSADTIAASAAQGAVTKSLEQVAAEQGTVSEASKITAAQMEPTSTAVGDLTAAQGTAAQVGPVATRTLQAGELVGGTAVDQAKVDAALKQNVAAQGTVTEDMTTQGQLNKILTNFDAGNPPSWAAASMRAATAQMAARGLGASSLAGQAIIQATLEAATPIAAADAKVFEQMGLTNLSNRQQMAVLTGQQRAAFLGQEFDQNFQTKVLNAARIADIADKNFTATVQIALENAQLANTMNVANLSAKNALVLAEAAQIANLETTNLNNRQQAAVENAKSFLAMDIKNLDNRQQTKLFKAKEIADVIVSDNAADNAAKATNAANKLDADKINANLALTASTFNAAEKNKVAITNQSAADAMLKFNAQEKNDRAEFNANLSTQISMANSKILADISMSNTREKNAIAQVNAKNATDMSATVFTQKTQTYRDQMELAYKRSDDNADRANEIIKQVIVSNAAIYSANQTADAAFYGAIGNALTKMATGSGGVTGLITDFKNAWNAITDLVPKK